MKYIPLESFEAINSLLHAVEALGCLVTIRLEAYTCRHTREERLIATRLAQYYTAVQSTPPISPTPVLMEPSSTFGAGIELPPPMVLGSAVEADGGSSTTVAPDGTPRHGPAPVAAAGAPPGTPLVTAEDIDERLVFMVAALNSTYAEDGYDFSVLTERDFIARTWAQLRDEMDLTLGQLPESCGPAVQQFWPAIHEQVGSGGDTAAACEVFQFHSPSCDPRAGTSIFSQQYFLYSKPRKILVSLLVYGEGNQYRGDDGYAPADADFAAEDDDTDTREHYASSPEPDDENEERQPPQYGGKNREFYGY